ncbi:MAG: helix-turn-helix transcriptional regulator [Betaproteobacteria bacterium]
MRAARLLSIQMLLETRGRMSARALAQALEVSPRTLHRDIDHLSSAGVPVIAERGRSGGFRLMDGWKTQLTGLTPAEAQAVFLSGLTGPAAQLGLHEPMQRAQLKLLSALPAAWREGASRVQSRLHLDPVDWYREPDPVPHLATVAEAVWGGHQLEIRYQGWTRASSRSTSPLGLVLKSGIWYFVGHANGSYRTYRIAAVKDARILPDRARRPRGFDLARHWRESVERFERSIYATKAEVLATPVGIEALRQLNSAAARAVGFARIATQGGRTRVCLPIESVAVATGQLLALGPDVEVIEPAALRNAIRVRLRELARTYA